MRTIYFVSLNFLWLLFLTANGAVTPSQNHISTNLTTGEVTASRKSFTSLNMTKQHLITELQAQKLSTRKTFSVKSFSTGPSPRRPKRTLQSDPSTDGRTTQPNSPSMTTTTMKPEGVSPTLHTKAASPYITLAQENKKTEAQATTASTATSQPPAQYSVASLQNESADIHTTPTPSISVLSQSNSSTEGTQYTTRVPPQLTSSTTMAITSQVDISSTEGPSPLPSTSSQNPSTEKTSDPINTTGKRFTISSMVRPTQATTSIFTETFSSNPVEHSSIHEGTVPGDGDGSAATRHTEGRHKTSMATTKIPFIHTTKKKKKQTPPAIKPRTNNHGTAVAWIIGGALVLMMIGFLIIYVKKQKLRKQQISTRDWAGPSPFLDGGNDSNGQAELRSTNRISLTSFLPQRLSRRLSLLQEMDEELEDIKTNSTFGDNVPGSTFGREVAEGDVQAGNATNEVVPEKTQMGEAPEAVCGEEVTSPQANDASSLNNPASEKTAAPLETAELEEDATTPPLSHSADPNPPPLLDDSPGQL